MAGTIVVDRIESDASYASTINVASQVTFSNTVNFAIGQRITGDFSNATVANRVSFQNSTSNSGTYTQNLPNGTSNGSGTILFNNSNPTNAAYAALTADASMIAVQSAITGTGTYLPMTFYTGGGERMRIDTSGNVLLGATSNTATPTGYISAANTFGFKNRLMNGTMAIDQRNAGAAFNVPNSSGYGSCDRWASIAGAGSVWTMQRVATGNLDFPFALRVKRTAASTSTSAMYWGQIIETNNCQDLAGQTVTFSFYATAGANFSGSGSILLTELWTGTGTDQGWTSLGSATWTGQTALIGNSTVITSTRTKYSFTVTLGASVSEIAIRWYYSGVGTAGAADHVDITGVQLEKGTVASSFDYRPHTTELQLCQRYYYRTTSLPLGYIINVADLYAGLVKFPVTMRTTPTLDSTGNSWAVTGGSAGTVGLRSGTGWGPNSDQAVTYNASSNWSAGNAAALTAGFSAEL